MEKYIVDINLITSLCGDEYNYVLAKEDEIVFKINNRYFVLVDDISKLNYERNIKDFIKNNKDNNMLLEKYGLIDSPYVGKLFVNNIRKLKVKTLKK